MSFSFGNTTNPPGLSFGAAASTPAKPAFGTGFSFGANTSATTGNPGTFGAASGFGAAANTATSSAPSAFGFGAPAVNTAPAFGAATPGFGAGTGAFGAPAASSAAPSFGTSTFGAPAGTSTFGAPGTSTFGAPGTTFGAPAQAPTLGAFGAPASTAGGTGLFGGAGTGAFGAPTSTSAGFGLSTGFGASTSGTAFGAGSTFGKPPGTGFGGFGTGLTGTTFGQTQPNLLGQPQQLQLQAPVNPNEALANSLFNCCVYGDDRDSTLARWNYLQAAWGIGKGYYSNNAPPVDISQANPMCRFKAIGYSAMPGKENREGLVAIIFNKKETEIKNQQPQLIASLNNVLGNKPNLLINLDGIKCLSESKTQVLIYVQEKGVTGTIKKIPATELTAFLLQPMQKQQLCTLGVENILPHILPDQEQIKEYLDTPPDGVDPRLWKQAQADNPNPVKYIPVPMVGFAEVKWRMKCQEEETKRHQAFLDKVAEDIACLQRKHTSTAAKIAEQHRKYVELQHRVLQVIVKQETTRKVGLALQPEEELLRSQFEAMQSQISAPTQFKGRLSELLSQIRMQRCNNSVTQYSERYKMDKVVQEEMKTFLQMQQQGLSRLIEIVNSDMDTLKVISEGMSQLLRDRGVPL